MTAIPARSTVCLTVLAALIGCAEPTTSAEPASDEKSAKEAFGPAPDGKVLRHAVFFAFKDESKSEDIKSVTEAFAALPSKIPEIIDFEWGSNNSPEGLDDGFTHCFILTFANEAGRATYLPHPAHKEFGNVLRPHMKDVFVIDYWGDAKLPEVKNPLRHAVFFRFKEDASPDAIQLIEKQFAALPSKISAIKAYEWGTNNSPEKHDDGFTHCFMVTFGSDEDRSVYLPHADHKAFVEVLKPSLDAPRVLDFFASETSEPATAGAAWEPLFNGKDLAGWEVTNFGGEGEVQVKDGEVIITQGVDLSGINSTRKDLPKLDYEIELEAKRQDGSDFFVGLTFPYRDSSCSLILGGWGGGVCGLSSLDGLDASENDTTSFTSFTTGQWYKVRLKVTGEMIEAWLDGAQIVEVETKDRKIDVRFEVDLAKPMGLSTYQTTAHVRNARMRAIAPSK